MTIILAIPVDLLPIDNHVEFFGKIYSEETAAPVAAKRLRLGVGRHLVAIAVVVFESLTGYCFWEVGEEV